MSHRSRLVCALAPVLAFPAWSQSVISVYSGVIHVAEGSVFLDNRPVEPRPGRFEEIKPGSELRLEDGRAEVLLTPGVFLRLGEGSAIRMVSNVLADTRVDLVHGPAIIDAAEPTPQTSVIVAVGDTQIRVRKAGRYRFNSNPSELRVSDGEAEVTVAGGKPFGVNSGHLLDVASGTIMRNSPISDDLDNWDRDRSEAIARSNLAGSQTPDLGSYVDNAPSYPGSYPGYPGSYGVAGLGGPGVIAPPGSLNSNMGLYPGLLGVSPYSYGSLWGSTYPYSLYSPYYYPSYLILPRYGITTVPAWGASSGLSGKRFPTTPGSLRSPVYHPTTPPTRTSPSFGAAHGMRGGRR
jgi:FecR protein